MLIPLPFQTKLDALNENFANVSSHVTSIEDEWPKYKQTAINLEASNKQLASNVLQLENTTAYLTTAIGNLARERQKAPEPSTFAGFDAGVRQEQEAKKVSISKFDEEGNFGNR